MTCCKPVKYVVFDLDGLLLDTEKIYYQIYVEILAKYGQTFTKEAFLKLMGTVPKDTFVFLIKEFNLSVTEEELEKEIDDMARVRVKSAPLMPGAEKLVKHLHKNNVPIAVATGSKEESFALKTENHAELFKLFHHVVFGGDPEVKRGKPAPDIYLVCVSRFPQVAEPQEVLVFEDAPNGVMGAKAAGMQVVMLPDPMVPDEKRQSATKVLSSLDEFKPEEFGLPKYE